MRGRGGYMRTDSVQCKDEKINLKIKKICIFAGGLQGSNKKFTELAIELGEFFSRNGIQMIYGGGSSGIMGSIAKAMLKTGGDVIGILPNFMRTNGHILHDIQLMYTNSIQERKELMFEQADAFLALPGGIGTLDEIIEVIHWTYLQLHSKQMFLFDVDNFAFC